MSNIATNIEKSKHLLELGLAPKTADMCLCKTAQDTWFLCAYSPSEYDAHTIPAWSLSALLEVMPMVNEGWPVCCKIYGSEKWHVLYHSTAVTPKIDSGEYDTPIRAAYQMVCCLLEQGLIKKVGNDE